MQTTQNTRNSSALSPRNSGTVTENRESSTHPASPAILGIWRLGRPVYASQHSKLFTAQPADAEGSPRFDYVLRTVTEQREYRNASVAQLQRFTSAASAANHPNLIVVLDASLESAQPFLIMPRLVGSTLTQLMTSATIQPLPVILWAARQAAQGLAALHAASWVHGDIKPENLFVSQQGHVTLLDLGFAQRIGTATNSTFLGTPHYAAPELTRSDLLASVTAASDVYSLGKVLFELLAWTAPTIHNLSLLEPVADLISEMIATEAPSRPTAADVASKLLRLEIETLGEHIQPQATSRRRAA